MPESELAEATLRRIGAYRVVRELGRGGMGVVYEAVHEHLQRRVAIKRMRPELVADPTQIERFVREGRAAANIRHPHVIDVYEFDFIDRAPYLVMDFLDGQTLGERLARCQRLPLPALLATLFPVLSAVAAAHAAGVVHRDLKPSNIMLSLLPDGREVPKVLDFGTSKLLTQPALVLTQSAAVIGTPYYMAPEQVRSSRDVDARCDQYALGVILYECATGRMPFDAASQYDLLHAIMSAPLAPPSSHEPSLPAAFDALVVRAMQRDPAQRFASVRALGAALLPLAPAELARRWSAEFGAADVAAPVARNARPESATLRDDERLGVSDTAEVAGPVARSARPQSAAPRDDERPVVARLARSHQLQWYALAGAAVAAAGAWWAMRGDSPQLGAAEVGQGANGVQLETAARTSSVSGNGQPNAQGLTSERESATASGTVERRQERAAAAPESVTSSGTVDSQAHAPSDGREGLRANAGADTAALVPSAVRDAGIASGSVEVHARVRSNERAGTASGGSADANARSSASSAPAASAAQHTAAKAKPVRSRSSGRSNSPPPVTLGDNGAPILE